MAKEKIQFSCQQCGMNYSKWMGKCQECGAWNSIVEEKVLKTPNNQKIDRPLESPQIVSEIAVERFARISSKINEFDMVLGGGLVPGSLVLLGGEPGIGKSTLLLQVAASFAKQGLSVLYVSGEESASQIAMRAQRLGLNENSLFILAETWLEQVYVQIENLKPQILVLDSIQTISTTSVDSPPGSVSQLRECTHQLLQLSKGKNIATFVVGHVTKEGSIAGPKVLEHMVDVVLYFESNPSQNYRLLRTIKNRFGSTHELGVFEMLSQGMKEVSNPSHLFLSESESQIAGSTVTSCLEGTRPILVEIQALVSQSYLPMPRRTSIGLDPNRLSLLVAILEKRAGFRFYDQDVYLNVAGGFRLEETSADLSVCASIISSFTGKCGPSDAILVGEVGLGGEIRPVSQIDLRLKEAKKIGFKSAFVPKKSKVDLEDRGKFEIVEIENIKSLKDYF